MKLSLKRPVNHALSTPKAPPSSRLSGSVTVAVGTVPTVSPSPALVVWKQLVPDELQPDDLMRAIDGAIEDIRIKARHRRVCVTAAGLLPLAA